MLTRTRKAHVTALAVPKTIVGIFRFNASVKQRTTRVELFGKCPKKKNESQGNPVVERAAMTAEGPGTGTTGMRLA
jgi:hypothetical protein